MNGAKRHFARDEHQLAALFEHDIGGASDQPFGIARTDTCQRFHAAGNNYHAVGTKRA
jgi:hypothetical protein